MNVVLITSDQHRGDCFGFEGRGVKTPHLDKMALEGTRFRNCITPGVVCQPARASLLTGLLPLTHGVRDNGIDLPPATGSKGFANTMSRAGIRTALIGKAHFSSFLTFEPTGSPECRFSQKDFGPHWHGPYMGFEHVELVVEGHNNTLPFVPPAGLHYSHWYYGDGQGDAKNALYLRDLGPSSDGAFETHYSALPLAWHNSTWVGDRTLEYIRRHQNEPFVVWASFPDPHHPFDCPEPWSRLHSPSGVDLPPVRARSLDEKPWWHRSYLEGASSISSDVQRMRSKANSLAPTDAQLRHIMAQYYGMISLIDHQVGRIEALLSELNLAKDTLVIFTSDHGEWLGDHGLLQKGPMFYEGLLRVGLVMRGPQVPAGKVVDDPVSTLDLAPTLLHAVGLSPDVPMQGQALWNVVAGNEAREHAFSEWDLGPGRRGVPLELQVARTQDAKLTLELRSGDGELYDLSRDPHEEHNLFHDPSSAALRSRLEGMIGARNLEDRSQALPYTGIA